MPTKILLIDDDAGITEPLSMYFEQSGFETYICKDGAQAMDMFHSTQPNLIVLDINLPNKSGIEICRDIRHISNVPILMLSARGDEKDRLTGFEHGADDYVPKPFSPREVIARIKTILRRGTKTTNQSSAPVRNGADFVYRDVTLTEMTLECSRHGKTHVLTKSEFQLLKRVLSSAGAIVTRQALMEEMGYNNYVHDRTIDTHIKNIRKKIGDDVIITVRGVGYKAF